jgi:hypothetical protein
VYAANLAGRNLTFDVYGVWRRNMILRDRQTHTLWQHATGQALIGALAGAQLMPLGGEQTTWGAWRSDHPDSYVALPAERWTGLLPLPVIRWLLERMTDALHVPGFTPLGKRLPSHAFVVGLAVNGAERAYPLSVLRQRQTLQDTLGGVQIELEYDHQADRVRGYRVEASSGKRIEELLISRQYWLGWCEFHPQTTVYAGTMDGRP